jgi:hypothetical protein
LVGYLLDGTPDGEMAEELADWLAGSARFREFGEMHRAKIRKKLRGAADPEAQLDVRAELQTAHLLLMDRRIEVAFEAYGSGRVGPDFTASFRGGRAFNLEVTRLRRLTAAAGHGGQLLAKLRQLPPSVPNAVLLAIEGDRAEALDVAATFRGLRARADAKEEPFFDSRGFDGSRGFYDRYLRLGAVVVWCEAAAGDARAAPWQNQSARIAFPEQELRACLACLRAG